MPKQLTSRPIQLTVRPTQLTARTTQLTVRPTQLTVRPRQLTVRPTQLTSRPTQLTDPHSYPGKDGADGYRGYPGEMGLDGERGEQGLPDSPTTTAPEPILPPKVKDCSLEKIGETVLYAENHFPLIRWMMDVKPNAYSDNKIWLYRDFEDNNIFEYANIDNFKDDIVGRLLTIENSKYVGTGHIIYNGTMYFQWSGEPKIVGLDLRLRQVTKVKEIPDLVYLHTESNNRKLYSSKSSFVDFKADENGLWMIYSTESSSNIKVALLNETTLDIIKSVDVDVALGSKRNAFIVCGKLYTTDFDLNQNVSFVDEERDLWKNSVRALSLNIDFDPDYSLSYAPNHNHLLFSKGKQMLRAPVQVQEE
ncbi:hypothetical protein Btru_034621 [Bulinus truncatus]|nr:hypothetical protein Btru_034621 [Bulinus truncatus]